MRGSTEIIYFFFQIIVFSFYKVLYLNFLVKDDSYTLDKCKQCCAVVRVR